MLYIIVKTCNFFPLWINFIMRVVCSRKYVLLYGARGLSLWNWTEWEFFMFTRKEWAVGWQWRVFMCFECQMDFERDIHATIKIKEANSLSWHGKDNSSSSRVDLVWTWLFFNAVMALLTYFLISFSTAVFGIVACMRVNLFSIIIKLSINESYEGKIKILMTQISWVI